MAREFKFLVLDHDSDIRFLHRHALRRVFDGCEVIEAQTCGEALAALVNSGRIDAIISDHQLQGSNGAECIALMRARGLTCPILLVTSSDDPKVHQKAYDSGATRVFPPADSDFIAFLRRELNLMSSPSYDFFPQLADGAPVMIWMSGLDMGCFYFNRAWLDFRGRTLEQESGNGWAEGVHPEDLQRCVNHYVSCFERRVAFAMSYRLQNGAGAFRWILDRGAPHYLPDGTFLGFFGGCAEIETDTPLSRHNELGTSLAQMKEFARQIATPNAIAARVSTDVQARQLTRFAQDVHESYEAQVRRLQHAADEIAQLADDMLAFGSIARGECLPARPVLAKSP